MTRRFPALIVPLLAVLFSPFAASAEIGTINQDLTVALDPAARRLTVAAKIEIDGDGRLAFRLARNFVVTAFAIDGEPAAARRLGEQWLIDLVGDRRHEVILEYRGALAPTAADGGAFTMMQPVSSPEGSFLAAGSNWHPTFDGRDFSYRLDITVPEPQRAVAPGRLIAEQSSNGVYRAVFTSEQPSGGIVLIAGPFRTGERRHRGITLRTYFHPDISALSDGYLKATADYIDLYSNWIGDYPYSVFDIVSGLLPVGLGYPGLTFMGKRVLALPFIRSSSLGHEVLHNWWGNGVAVDYPTGNWSEGLTTFMADYEFARRRSENDARAMRIGWLRDYAALPPARDQPVVSFVSRSHDAEQIIGYNKVAFIFHMLRRKIGRAAFDSGIRLFWQRHAFATAAWSDLRKVFEETSGQDLGYFFRQWLQQSGAPKLVLENAKTDGYRVSFTLRQDSGGYRLTVPVEVLTGEGRQRFNVDVEDGANDLELVAGSPVLGLTIDPDFDIFRHLGPAEAPPILRDVTLSQETRVVVLGENGDMADLAGNLAGRLLDTGSRPVIVGSGGPLPEAPLLLIGEDADMAAFLIRHGLPPVPGNIAGKGTARVWASRRDGRNGNPLPIMIIAVDSPAALAALTRPLPHYRRQGYIVFDGGEAIAKGAQPAAHGSLTVRFR